MDKSNKSGAEALLHSLHLEGVELMFGYPGVLLSIFTMQFLTKTMLIIFS
jgi:thiamine pyrophosphate-dependent acetolactate synthase large subunit-like protein